MTSTLIAMIGLAPGCVNYIGIHSNKKIASISQYHVDKSLPQQKGDWPTMDWASQFGDPQLISLIKEALANSPDLAVAKARIVQARAMAQGKAAALYPNAGLVGVAERVRLSSHNFLPPPLGNSTFNFSSFLVSINYTLDIWGKNLANLRQFISQEKASEAAMQESRLAIATSVASTYNQLAYYYDLRDVLKRTVAQRQQLDKISAVRLHTGLDTRVQLYQARNTTANAKTQLVEINGQILVTKQQLGTLLGSGPDRGLTIKRPQLSSTKTPALPANLPLELLGHRADIVAARWRVEAACQGIRFVKAQFYPNIDLKAGVGYLSLVLTQFVVRANTEYLGPAISLPLFDGGALRAQLKGQYGIYEEAVANYNVTLNNAFSDVVTQLTTIKSIDAQLSTQWEGFNAAKRAYNLARYQYKAGLASQLVVLDAETRHLNEQKSRLQLIANRRNLQIALIKALGGGFDAQRSEAQCCRASFGISK